MLKDEAEESTKRGINEGEARLQDRKALTAERLRCDTLQGKLRELELKHNNLQLENLSQQAALKTQLDAVVQNVCSLQEQLQQQRDAHRNQCAEQQRQIEDLASTNAQLHIHKDRYDELVNQRDQLLSDNTKLNASTSN